MAVAETLAAPRDPHVAARTLTDSFSICDIDGLRLLKMCGFIESQQARLVDVSETHVQLRIGRTWWERLFLGAGPHPPFDVTLTFRAVDETSRPERFPQAIVDVCIRPAGLWVHPDVFRASARELVRQIRWHFLAC